MLKKTTILIVAVLLLLAHASAARAEAQRITLDFVDVELATFAKFVSETTGKNFVFDERLKGKITIMAPSGLGKADVFSLFSSVLELKGFTLQPSAVDLYKIIPVSEARQKGLPVQAKVNDSYMIKIMELNYITPDEAVRILNPVISKDGYLAAMSQGNYLIVIDTGFNIEKLSAILEVIDSPPALQESELIMLRYSSAEDVARILNEGFQGMDKARLGVQRAIAEPRLNAVVLSGSRADKEAMKRLIALLDVPAAAVQGGINVYFLEYADATELADTLQGIISGQLRDKRVLLQGQQPVAAVNAGAERITVTPDKATNALVIAASQADYQGLMGIIKQLDRQRRQVFVEAMIVEASVDDLKEVGTRWRATAEQNNAPIIIGGVGKIDSSAILNIINGLSGLTLGGLGNFMDITVTDADGNTKTLTVPGYAAIFSLSQFKNIINVLSTPQILTSDNQEAEIIVGENVPFITRRETAPTAGVLISSAIERRDVGIKLKITPHITEGDSVRLSIYQEISSVKEPPASIAREILTEVGPTTTMRSTKTSVIVKDNQTIVIGGLMSEKLEKNVTKVPLLGDIPILGLLFKNTSDMKQKTNLLVFISPRVIKTPADIEKISEEKTKTFGQKPSLYKAGELMVKFRNGVSEDKARAIILSMEARVLKKLREGLYHIKLMEGQDVLEAVREFADIPEVQYAEPNYIMKTTGEDGKRIF